MQDRPERAPAHRSAFTAAFLSLLFPGLGHAYAGVFARALAFAAVPVLLLALAAGLLADTDLRRSLLFALLDTRVLVAILVIDGVVLLYRTVAILDAYRVAALADALARSGARYGLPRLRPHPLSLAGLLAVVLVVAGGHAAVAYYGLTAYDLLTTITTGGDNASPSPYPSGAAPSGASPTPRLTPSPGATPASTPTPLPTWSGKERLNILVVGVDRRPHEGTFNTDTLITVSVDPVSGQVAMFSLPRDTVDVPLPRAWPAYSYYGGVYPAKINSLWTRARGAPGLFPFDDSNRGYAALKGALGELYGLDVRWYVEVDFQGFQEVVDTLGGVLVRPQLPVRDDQYPLEDGRGSTRLYVPAVPQWMDGELALAYARSRHLSSDFDRAQRQQQVLVALREQADVPNLVANLPQLVAALKSSIHTDIPAAELSRLAGLAATIDTGTIRSVVFTPPVYQVEKRSGDPRGYVIIPKVSLIRQAVTDALETAPPPEETREAVAAEGASVWVLNGSGVEGQATRTAAYLQAQGFGAEVPAAGGGRADRQDYPDTVVAVYNGAAQRLGATVAALERIFAVQVVERTDPNVKVDIIVITGARTPTLASPD